MGRCVHAVGERGEMLVMLAVMLAVGIAPHCSRESELRGRTNLVPWHDEALLRQLSRKPRSLVPTSRQARLS